MNYHQSGGGVQVYHYEQHPCSSKTLQLPMSRLGAWPQLVDNFPDPVSLKPLPQLPSNDFFSSTLIQQWSSSLETCSKQV